MTQGLVRGDEGIILVEVPMVTPGAGNDLHGAFKARTLLSRPGFCFQGQATGSGLRTDAARPNKVAASVKFWVVTWVRIMSRERLL